MSEHGSFVTEYIFCEKCLKAAKKVLSRKSDKKYLWGVTIPNQPIIAGRIGALGESEEITQFDGYYVPMLEKVLCHPLRVAVLTESGAHEVFEIKPDDK